MTAEIHREFGAVISRLARHQNLDRQEAAQAFSTVLNDATTPMQQGAFLAALAAKEQGQFWAFHDSVFATPRGDNTSLKSIAEKLDLDLERFETQRAEALTRARIQSDIELGARLGVDGTPSVFINGRRVYDIRPKTLLLLIAHEILAANQVPQEHPQLVSMAAH